MVLGITCRRHQIADHTDLMCSLMSLLNQRPLKKGSSVWYSRPCVIACVSVSIWKRERMRAGLCSIKVHANIYSVRKWKIDLHRIWNTIARTLLNSQTCNQNANTQKQREKAWHCFVCVMSCLRLRGCHGQVLNIKKPRGNWSCGSETLIWSCTWRRARQESCGSESVSQLLDYP